VITGGVPVGNLPTSPFVTVRTRDLILNRSSSPSMNPECIQSADASVQANLLIVTVRIAKFNRADSPHFATGVTTKSGPLFLMVAIKKLNQKISKKSGRKRARNITTSLTEDRVSDL